MQGNVSIKIDGRDLAVERGFTILEAGRQAGIEIPTLCFDEALEPYAACRLCVVELSVKGVKRFVASCVYPVEEGAEVMTSTDEILRHRRLLVELYLSRSPEARKIRELAEQLGVGEPRYKFPETHNCIACGLCVRACNEIVGAGAIGFSQRGMKRRVEPPFRRGSATCISCGTCTTICPTEAITLKEIDQVKSVHVAGEGASIEPCSVCAAFEIVPKLPDDYVGWLSEKISGKPAAKTVK
ncbi:MAG: 2Fe-2S iron-sulfur cluster-binding protein [Candidatus Eisenbacteria bacterium]|nr:2Fe-2S iron-sulfur cluster-binding protein [Candidatus Eisenbacteria bacterium]